MGDLTGCRGTLTESIKYVIPCSRGTFPKLDARMEDHVYTVKGFKSVTAISDEMRDVIETE
jgi:hypothetical protein